MGAIALLGAAGGFQDAQRVNDPKRSPANREGAEESDLLAFVDALAHLLDELLAERRQVVGYTDR